MERGQDSMGGAGPFPTAVACFEFHSGLLWIVRDLSHGRSLSLRLVFLLTRRMVPSSNNRRQR